jgi:hypothetical protein
MKKKKESKEEQTILSIYLDTKELAMTFSLSGMPVKEFLMVKLQGEKIQDYCPQCGAEKVKSIKNGEEWCVNEYCCWSSEETIEEFIKAVLEQKKSEK